MSLIETLNLKLTDRSKRWSLSLFPDQRVQQELFTSEVREPTEFPDIIAFITENLVNMKIEMIKTSPSTIIECLDGTNDPIRLLSIWLSEQ